MGRGSVSLTVMINSFSLIFPTTLGVYNVLTLYLNGKLDSVIMYPVLSVGGMAFTTLWSVTIFKDKLGCKKALVLLLGTLAVVLISL